MPEEDAAIREVLLEMLRGGSAHADFETAVDGLGLEFCGRKVPPLPHTIWQLVEHIRLVQQDLVNFSTNPEYVAPEWPRDYWPPAEAARDQAEWEESLRAVNAGCREFARLVGDGRTNLAARIPWGSGQNFLREVLLNVSHGSYHIGQIILLRQLLGVWTP